MRLRSFRLLAIVFVLAIVASACFAPRAFFWANPHPDAGGSSFAVMKMFPYDDGAYTDDYQFVMVGWESSETGISTAKRRFDINGAYGGPYTMIQDNALRNWILGNAGLCKSNGVDVTDITGTQWKLFRTTVPVDIPANSSKTLARESVKMTFADPDVYPVTFVTGVWIDSDSSGTAGSGDTAACTGMIFTSIPVGS